MKLIAAVLMPAVARPTPNASAPAAADMPTLAEHNAPPSPHSRLWVADHLGLAADALGVATTQLGHVAPNVIGNFLAQASRELCDLLPDAPTVFPSSTGITTDLMNVNKAIELLARQYFLQHKLPPATVSVGLLLARYTYTVRRAQDVLEGIGI
ncbi:MAG: hypothetical protein H7123_05645 [Thermoleophilia bacterium]|nr:hypothetical protein [Thermoleophilia bacterium]